LSKRGQTSIEELFILIIILAGAMVVIPGYLDNDAKASVVVHVKDVTREGCDYLNLGVIINESKYAPLNGIINSSVRCFLKRISFEENKSEINVTIYVESNANVSEALKEFIINSLREREGFSYSNGVLSYRGIKVKVEVLES